MNTWKDWRLRAREAKKRSKKSDADLAVALTETTGRKSGRAEVNHWFNGVREPTLSQFMVLCHELNVDPSLILFGEPLLSALTISQGAKAAPKPVTKRQKGYTIDEQPIRVGKVRLRRGTRPPDAPIQ